MIRIPYQKNLELEEEPSGIIGHYGWMENGYTPYAAFYWAYNEEALRVRLVSAVKELTVFTTRDDGEVWADNCMELFFQLFRDDPDYLNVECNPLGCMVIQKGAGRENRALLTARLKPQMEVCTVIRPGSGWEAGYIIPFSAIAELYQRPFRPEKGDLLRFNAYICGEKTPLMHFGSCFPIDTPQPDFHRPEFFGIGAFN